MIDGLITMMSSVETGPINLGQPEAEVSINKLAEVLETMLGKSVEKTYKSLPADDPKQRRPNIEQAIEKLGWKPKTTLVDGLEKTYSYFL
jgi:UDP-glucuronate decarboxylase